MTIENFNYLLPAKASLQIVGAQDFSIQAQTFNIPSLYGYVATHPTPMSDRPLPGNKMVYDILEVSFLINENIDSWLNLHQWMRGLYAPEGTHEYKDKTLYLQEGILNIYTSTNKLNFAIHFIDLFPVKLDKVIFDLENTDAAPVKTKVEFAYLRYDIKKHG